jgi:3-oxoacyl-[acyl-carrier-protein] synthase II
MVCVTSTPAGVRSEPRTVGVAGYGAVSSIGADPASCFAALLRGDTGLGPLQVFDPDRFTVRRAYEVADRPDGADVPGRAGRLLRDAVRQAMQGAGIGDLADVPVLVGTGLGERRTAELAWLGRAAVTPEQLHLGTALAGLGAEDVQVFSNACSASLYVLALGADLVVGGRCDTVVVAGVDVLTASMFGLLDRVHLDPPDRVRPFDAERKGVVLGEGAAAVVLSAGAAAGPRLAAVALGCDAHHVTAPHPAGIERTIRDGHAAAGILAEDVDVVYTHGTGTLLNDRAEAGALSAVFADVHPGPAMTAVKAATGHTSGGSGLFSLVMAALSLRTAHVPGVAGLGELDEAARTLSLSPSSRRLPRARYAQVDAFGFGGLNAVAILHQDEVGA